MKIFLGVDVGGTYTKIGIFNKNLELQKTFKINTDISEKGTHIAENIFKYLEPKLKDFYKEYEILAIGVGVPGFANKEGIVLKAGNIGWNNYDFSNELKKYFNVPIIIKNDVQTHTIAEKEFGSAKNAKNFVLLALGTGLGSGIYIEGELYTGNLGCAGEIGHIPIQNKFKCSCGLPFCSEPIFSATGLINFFSDIKNSTEMINENKLAEYNGAYIISLAKDGDPTALKSINYLAKNGAKLLAIYTHLLNPEMIILSGGITIKNNILLNNLKKEYKKLVHDFQYESTEIIISNLENDIGIRGAATLAKNYYEKLMYT